MQFKSLSFGDVEFNLSIEDGDLRSLGAVKIAATPIRNPVTRFLPWIDTFEGDVFRRFKLANVEVDETRTVIETRAIGDPDVVFRERRDSSGDPCFRNANWDAPPLEAAMRIVLEPARRMIDGRSFTGFKYHFEFESDSIPVHRILDRQTWEVGGNLDDVTICLRNWLTPPRMKIAKETTYSTVGLDKWAGLLPGNMWGRWSLLPGFDMQYGAGGILLGMFDGVSLIRTVLESNAGEDSLRCLDLHLFEQGTSVRTNPKTILFCPDRLDATDALNFWTRLQDADAAMARKQFRMEPEAPPAVSLSQNWWKDFHFDPPEGSGLNGYDVVMNVAEEFGADQIFIDPVWEHGEALRAELERALPGAQREGSTLAKFAGEINMCCTFDFEVAREMGGEAALKRLVDRAKARGLRVISWMSSHYHPHTILGTNAALGHGAGGIFAARESGRHPDTGYPSACWTANLNAPVYEKIRAQIMGTCQRTGLGGFLWDSYCNMGWWSVDYSKGDMRPQFDRMAQLYADLSNAGLYIMPEAIVSFSSHSCCGLHGGNVYADDLLGYSYNSNIAMHFADQSTTSTLVTDSLGVMPAEQECRMIRGQAGTDLFFRCAAHKRMPGMQFHHVPRDEWHAESVAEMKRIIATYKAARGLMHKRTVLKDDRGVMWEGECGERLIWSFKDHQTESKNATEILTGEQTSNGVLKAGHAYHLG